MKYVALLRGINVGGNNKVEMKRLKACFEALHFTEVTTYINSGNVIFSAPKTDEVKLVKLIERAIENTFGFPVRVVVRTGKNIVKIGQAIPSSWENDAAQKSDVLFLWDDYANKKSLKLIDAKNGIDNLLYVDRAILWNLSKNNYSKSGMSRFVGTELYKNMTARNVNTVRKLAELVEK